MNDRYTSKQLTDHCFDKGKINSKYIILQRDSISGKAYDTDFIKECINTVEDFSTLRPVITSLFQVTNNTTIHKHRVQKNITYSICELILHKRKRLYSIILY